MERADCSQAVAISRKGKQKHAKDELDRQKQAEKKKRRLEKALATSAAIRSELEKKKQKKLEEQQRLDKEGAAIAEAVALHVLLEEDTDESCQIMLNTNERCNSWDHPSSIGLFMGYPSFGKYTSVGGFEWVTDAYKSDCQWNDWGSACLLSQRMHLRDFQTSCYKETDQGAENCPGLIAARAVSSLHIADDTHKDPFTSQGRATVVINKMVESSKLGTRMNLFKDF